MGPMSTPSPITRLHLRWRKVSIVLLGGLLWGDVGPSQADQIRLHDGSVRAGTIVAASGEASFARADRQIDVL